MSDVIGGRVRTAVEQTTSDQVAESLIYLRALPQAGGSARGRLQKGAPFLVSEHAL